MSNFCVLGAGQLGRGIGLVAAVVGRYNVTMVDPNEKAIDSAKTFCSSWLSKRNFRNSDNKLIVPKISYMSHATVETINSASCIVEAVPENFEMKSKILRNVSELLVNDDTIIATNTSSIPIGQLAKEISRPQQFLGMHFMHPATVMPLVELVASMRTAESIGLRAREVVTRLGKIFAVCKDSSGFVSNRLLMPYLNEAFFVLGENLASAEDIDRIMKSGTNVPMGPLRLADFIGLDTCLNIIKTIFRNTGDPKFRPAPLLVRMVEAGLLGQKSGAGVYAYSKK